MTHILLSAAEITVTMSAVILLLILVNRAAGERFTAKCRYILWCIVMLRLAIPVGAPFQSTLIRLEVPAELMTQEISMPAEEEIPGDDGGSDRTVLPETTSQPSETLSGVISAEKKDNDALPEGISGLIFISESQPEEDFSMQTGIEQTDVPELTESVEGNNAEKSFSGEMLLNWLAGIYLACAAGFFGLRMAEHLITAKILRSSRRTVAKEMQAVCAEQCRRCGIRRKPELYASARVTSPMLFGYFRPCILLPLNIDCPEKAAGILRHELIHWKRGDLWVKLICLIAQSFHWFNPLVHMAAGRCCREMELSCDESVLDGLGEEERKEYGLIMLDVVKFCRRRYSGLTTQFNPRRNVVFERFENILDMRRKNRGAALIALVLAVSMCAGMVLSCTVQSDSGDITGQNRENPSESMESDEQERAHVDEALVKEAYKNSKPVGKVRKITDPELGHVNMAFAAVDILWKDYRIEYEEMLEYMNAWNQNQLKANQETDSGKAHTYADLARTYRKEYRYAAEYLEEMFPKAMFCSDGIRIRIPVNHKDRVMILPGNDDTAFAIAYEKKDDGITELFRIIRLTADRLLPVEEYDLDTTYFACDGQYYYAVQYPYHVKNDLRDDVIASVCHTFITGNPGMKAVSDASVQSMAEKLADASYETCWNNMAAGLWSPASVVYTDVVKGISAKLVNRMLEHLERGESIADLKITGVQLTADVAPTVELTLPEGVSVPDPITAEEMSSFFVGNRYDPSCLYYRIPVDDSYALEIRFLFSQSKLRFQSVVMVNRSDLSDYDYNTSAAELYDLYHDGKLTAKQLMQYPAVQYDLLEIITEVTDNVENKDTAGRKNYSVGAIQKKLEEGYKMVIPTMTEMGNYFRMWEGGDIVYLYRCISGIYARIEVTVGTSLELKSASMGYITDLITDYSELYALYEAGEITREALYTHDTVLEMGTELVNTILSAFRRDMNPNALFAGEEYAAPVTYPGGGVIISDIQPEKLKSYAEGDYGSYSAVEHPYDCYRIPLHGGFRLEIWYELSEGGMRGIHVRLAEVMPSSYRTLSKSVLYQKVRNGEAKLTGILKAGTVQSDISDLFQRVFYPLSRKEYVGYLEPWDCPGIANGSVARLIAMSSMGEPILCYSPDGKILYEAGLKLLSDDQSSRLEASYIGVRIIGERKLTVLTDCFVDSERVECALTLPDLYAFDTVKVHWILNMDGRDRCLAELIRGENSTWILADVAETIGKVYVCDAGDDPHVLSESEAAELLIP